MDCAASVRMKGKRADPAKTPLPNFPLGSAASGNIFPLEAQTTWVPELRTYPLIHQS